MEKEGEEFMGNETGKVSFLGQFQMVYHGIALTEDDIHSEMITKLLAYMLLHRKRAMTIRELADMLWGGGGSNNPVGALKNLMYRLRGVLKQTYGGEEQFVLTNLGSYCWNNEMTPLSSKGFYKNLRSKGYQDYKSKGGRYFKDMCSKVPRRAESGADFEPATPRENALFTEKSS